MSGLPDQTLTDLLTFAANGDRDALVFMHKVANFARQTDDIADGAAPRPTTAVALQFDLVFVSLANDPFYEKWRGAFTFLLPLLVLLWSRTDDWRAYPNRNVRITGYVYRESIELITFMAAYIVGGPNHALDVIEQVVILTRTDTAETFEDWETE